MDSFEKLLALAFRYLALRPHSEKEVTDYLKKKKFPQEVEDNVLAYLKEHRLVDDEEFARWFVDQRTRVKPKGIHVIRLELKQKGIAEEVIERVFKTPDSDTKPQVEIAQKLVESRLSRYSHLSKQEIYQKLGAFLARRGFDWETIRRALDATLSK